MADTTPTKNPEVTNSEPAPQQIQEDQAGPSDPQAQPGQTGSTDQRTAPGRKPLSRT